MDDVLNYLRDMVDENAKIEDWNAKNHLNLHLAGAYDYYLVTVLAETFLLIKPVEQQAVYKIKLHMSIIQEKTKYETAILLNDTTPYVIKKMLKERIAFITADKQMYLPFLALHIKKQQKKNFEAQTKEQFTAATQLVFLTMLYSDKEQFGAEELARDLNVSVMTVLRAVDELKNIGVIHCETGGRTGRKKIIKPIEKKMYYQIGKKFLINPVKKRMDVSGFPERIKAYKCGLTALGEQTMLGEPEREIYAVYGNIKEVSKYQITKAQALSENLPEIQVMKYDIGKLTENQYVDPVTMLLSLQQTDDRIEIAVEEFMEGTEWYEG